MCVAGPPLNEIRLTESAKAVASPISWFAAPGPIEVSAAIGRPEERQNPSAMWIALCSWNTWISGMSQPSCKKPSNSDHTPCPGIPAACVTPYWLRVRPTISPPVSSGIGSSSGLGSRTGICARGPGGERIALHGSQRRQLIEIVPHEICQALTIDHDALDASRPQGVHRAAQILLTVQQLARDQREHRVELKLSGVKRSRDRRVAPADPERELVDELRDHRIDLARHHRRAALHRREEQLSESAMWPRRQESEIIRDLGQRDGAAAQRA